MGRYITRRVILALVTLLLISVVIFVGTQLLPGDVGRRVLGPFATQEAVDALNAQLGTDRPILVQYWDWLTSALRGDLGFSIAFTRPVTDILGRAIINSGKLAIVAFVIVVPLSIAGGVWAALRRDTAVDRIITVGGLSATVIPEFVSGIILLLIFSIWLGWFPVSAAVPAGAGLLTQLRYLLLPALTLVLVLFGYIARITRAGVIEALESDYTRTAVLKGLPWGRVIRRDVLRNALLPTIAVIASQVGYLLGGLVVVEVLFNYQGIGRLLYSAAQQADFPLLAGGVLVVAVGFQVSMLLADLAYAWLNPRIRLGSTG